MKYKQYVISEEKEINTPGVGNADLRSLQKKTFNAFVHEIGI
jgi:hypothetical protein